MICISGMRRTMTSTISADMGCRRRIEIGIETVTIRGIIDSLHIHIFHTKQI